MSEPKWTAGPWMMAAKPSSVVGWPIVAQTGRSIASLSYVDHSSYAESNAESKANGHLIAAAPDLIAALEGILSEPSLNLQKNDGTELAPWLAFAYAALTKARGAP